MPDCVHLARTSAYFDGAVPADEHAEVLGHLASCRACQALLGDAVTFDALLSQAPRRAARRRWPVALAAAGLAAAAAVAVWLAVPRPPAPAEVAIALPPARAIEGRFTGARFAVHRPYDPLRGDRAREPIALASLAELERRGDVADLVAALAATGDLGRARELAARLPDSAAAESDRAAIALAGDAREEALAHAYHAIDRAPELAAGWWNLALAARAEGLSRVSRAAFAAVAARAEPGWADEARGQIAVLDRELVPEDTERAAFDQHGRAMLDGGPPITVAEVRAFPTWARIYLLDAVRMRAGAELAPLRPLAQALDERSGVSTMTQAIARAAAADPARRAGFAARYRKAKAGAATPAEIDALLDALRAAGHPADDLRVGLIILSGQAPRRLAELRALVAPWHDPWFELAIERDQIRASYPPGDARAEPVLAAALARCTGEPWALRCAQLAYDLAERLSILGRDLEAEPWAREAITRYRVAGSPLHLQIARALLADLHRNLTRAGLARAEFDEVVRGGGTNCTTRRFAQIGQASLALFAGDWAAARAALPPAEPEDGCAASPDFLAIGTAVDLARHSGEPRDLETAHRWLARDADFAAGGLTVVGALRLARGRDPAAADAVRAWIAAHREATEQPVQMARVWGSTTLISDAGARGDWAGVVAAAVAEHGVALTQPCLVVATFDDDNVTIAARIGGAPAIGARRAVTASELAGQHLVPPDVAQALAPCQAIAVLARPPLHGRSDLLPAALPWAFAGDTATRAPGAGPPHRVDISDARPPDPSLPRLAPAAASAPFDRRSQIAGGGDPDGSAGGAGGRPRGIDTSLTGADATPSRVLAALADATYAELHVHGVAAAANDDATYLALSPDRDGSFALRADAVRAAHLTRGPLIVLAACRASTVAPYLHQRWSLPDAFVAAGASAVVAADLAIPDASARRVFDDLHRRIAAGAPVEAAVAAIRASATGDTAWATHLMVFR
jgi:cellulose synthase operon protein C